MKIRLKETAAAALLICGAAALFLTLPLPLAFGSDFSQLYSTLLGIVAGEKIYDYHAHQHLARQLGAISAGFQLNPPAYPPWYYLLLYPLGALELERAGRVWALINFVMLCGAIIGLTPGCSVIRRALYLMAAVLFAPTLGSIVVGQQTIVLLLGAVLLWRGIERNTGITAAVGAGLLTFKPHLGLPLLLGAALRLLSEHRAFIRSTAGIFIFIMALLIGGSWLLDSGSLESYPASLLALSRLSLNQLCDSCSSLPVALERIRAEHGEVLWNTRFFYAAVSATALYLPLWWMRRRYTTAHFMSLVVCLTLVVTPYARNYDYLLLLFPLLVVAEDKAAGVGLRLQAAVSYLVCGIGGYVLPRELQSLIFWFIPLALYFGIYRQARRCTGVPQSDRGEDRRAGE